jgi:hypothetical protein
MAGANDSLIFREFASLKGCPHVRTIVVYGVDLTPMVQEKDVTSADLYHPPPTFGKLILRKSLDPIHLALLAPYCVSCAAVFYRSEGLEEVCHRSKKGRYFLGIATIPPAWPAILSPL